MQYFLLQLPIRRHKLRFTHESAAVQNSSSHSRCNCRKSHQNKSITFRILKFPNFGQPSKNFVLDTMHNKTFVVDNGSSNIYVGLAGEHEPVAVIPNIIGDNSPFDVANLKSPEIYKSVCEKLKIGQLEFSYPVENGVIQDWDKMETLWSYAFSDVLKDNPKEANLLITEAVLMPKSQREKMAEIFFEKFGFPAISVCLAPVLSLYASGLTSGVVLECGDGVTQSVPISGGYAVKEAMTKCDVAGKSITNLLQKLLEKKGNLKPTEVVKMIKENISCVLEAQKEPPAKISKPGPTQYVLPDGETLQIDDEGIVCTEIMFSSGDGSLTESVAVHEMLQSSISKTNSDIQKKMYSNIVLSGGSTMTQGFTERLTKEIEALAPSDAVVKIRAHEQRRLATWMGGSILAALPGFQDILVSKDDYLNFGPSKIHQV